MSECGQESSFGMKCSLPAHHDSPHCRDEDGATFEWEPRYVAELRDQISCLRDDLAWAIEDRDEYRNKLANHDPSVGFAPTSDDDEAAA